MAVAIVAGLATVTGMWFGVAGAAESPPPDDGDTTTTETPAIVAPGNSTTTTIAPDDDGGSSGTGMGLAIGGLVGVAVAVSVLTLLYWRHTKPAPASTVLDELAGAGAAASAQGPVATADTSIDALGVAIAAAPAVAEDAVSDPAVAEEEVPGPDVAPVVGDVAGRAGAEREVGPTVPDGAEPAPGGAGPRGAGAGGAAGLGLGATEVGPRSPDAEGEIRRPRPAAHPAGAPTRPVRGRRVDSDAEAIPAGGPGFRILGPVGAPAADADEPDRGVEPTPTAAEGERQRPRADAAAASAPEPNGAEQRLMLWDERSEEPELDALDVGDLFGDADDRG